MNLQTSILNRRGRNSLLTLGIDLLDPWKNKYDYLLILALAFVPFNVSTHDLIQFKDLNVLKLGVSYCTKFDYRSDMLPIPFTVIQNVMIKTIY